VRGAATGERHVGRVVAPRDTRRPTARRPRPPPSPPAPLRRRTAFNEYQLCVDKRSKEDALCLQRGRDYLTLCPAKWVETWKSQAEAGVSMSVGTAFVGE
jgi:hypothetical protein